MARGQRKTLEEKIAEQQELVNALTIRLSKEKDALEALLNEQKLLRLESLNKVILEANLSPEEVSDIIQQYLSNQYEATA